jgi:hypothetical protein
MSSNADPSLLNILVHPKGRFTPKGQAKSPWGRLHEMLALFELEAGLNYTL